jgi:dTDP-4-dehydrorhamnose 3,5-epimerase
MSPRAETKTIRCLKGAIFDVIIDLRLDLPSYKKWFGIELTAENRCSMCRNISPMASSHWRIQEVFYLVSEYYAPDCERESAMTIRVRSFMACED